jgi:hypothetical protein
MTNKCWQRLHTCNGSIIDPDLEPGLCGAREGQLHRLGCQYERCTECGRQSLYCDCPDDVRVARERVPYFHIGWHLHCARCDAPFPEFFHVADEAWGFYILRLGVTDKHGARDQLLCVDCFRLIARLTDGGPMLRRHGCPIMLDDPKYHEVVEKRHALTEARRKR